MKVALYLRMSTDRQDTSIPQQRAALERHAERAGYTVVREYRDEGISGDATGKRKGFQKMIADAEDGDFDRILCFDQDRFGRFDMIEAGRWISPLRDAGVSLETIAQGTIDWEDFAGRLTYAVAQEGKHQFLRDLSRNCLRGNVAKAKSGQGMYGAPAPYGYRRESTLEGRHTITKLVRDAFEAAVVRRIFETYAATGGTLLAVGELLNGEKIAPPSGKGTWHRNAVRRILRNRVYAGDYVWGKISSGKYHTRAGDEIVKRRRNGKARTTNDPIVHEGILPALVSRALFDKVQSLLDRRRKATHRRGTVRPLSGLITCGTCGSPMHVNLNDYRCSRSVGFGDGTRCPTQVARGDYLTQAIAEHLQRHILPPKQLAAVKAKLERIVKAEQGESGRGGTAALDRQIAEIERQIAEGIARIPLLPKSLVPEMGKSLDAMRAQRDAIKRQRDAASTSRGDRSSPLRARIDDAIAAAYGLRKALAEADAAAVNEGLRHLGVRVLFGRRAAQVIVDPLNPCENAKLGLKPHSTCNAPPFERFKSKAGAVLTFTVPIPAETPTKRRGRAG